MAVILVGSGGVPLAPRRSVRGHPGGGHPGYPGRPGFPRPSGLPGHPGHWTLHHHGHWIFRDGRWIIIDQVVEDVPVVVPAPGPCTCLTKNYTPDGLVVFADVCTKEAASARADGSSAAATPAPAIDRKAADATPVPAAAGPDASQAPTSPNYAGRTYQDYLAANQQAANQAPQKN